MAFGAVLLSFPTAVASTVWATMLHEMTLLETAGIYATFGFLTLITVLTAALLARD